MFAGAVDATFAFGTMRPARRPTVSRFLVLWNRLDLRFEDLGAQQFKNAA